MTLAAATMKTLPQAFVDRATAEPDRLIARHKYRGIWREFRYRDVLERVRNLAVGLQSMSFARGETVAIIGENEPENFWVELAVLSLGGKVVSLYPDLTVGEIEYLLNDSQAVYFVGQDQEQIDKGLAVLGSVPTLRRLIYWDDTGMWSYRQPSLMKLEQMEDEGRKRNAAEPGLFDSLVELGQPDDIAILSYTSGTTGRPKGVVITHRYLIDNAHRLVNGTDLTPGMDYLTYIAPAWVTEQLFGVTIGVTSRWWSTFRSCRNRFWPISANSRSRRWCLPPGNGRAWRRRSRQRCSTRAQSAAAFTNGASRSDARSMSLDSTASRCRWQPAWHFRSRRLWF